MSTPPKEPKPGAGPTLEHTFLGVAPAAPDPASTPPAAPASSNPPPSSSAIVAAPMISVSGDRKAQPAAPPTPPAPPARPAPLQGGWQSAGTARPAATDQTAVQGTPGAWPMPPPGAPAPAEPRALPPRPESYAPSAPAAAREASTPQSPRPAAPAAASGGGGLHHTALASDYLRNARDALLGAGAAPAAPRVVSPALPGVESLPARSPQPPQYYAAPQPLQHYAPPQPLQHYAPPQPPPEYEPPGPPTQMPVSEAPFTAASGAPASAPAVTASPPATAPLSEPIPVPYAPPAAQPVVVYAREPEALHGPRSMGTQASVAPPPSGPELAPSPGALARALLAQAPNPARGAAPNPMAGTMLERTPSVPGSALPATAPPATALSQSLPGGASTRFEQVPSARGSLGQQATGFGLHIPIDQSATDWGRPGHVPAAGKAPSKRGSPLRLIVLAALALAAIGFALFGKQLLGGATAARGTRVEVEESARGSAADTRSPDQATLANLPSPAAAANAAPGAAPAAAAAPTVAAPTAAVLAAPAPAVAAAPALAAVPSVPVQAEPGAKLTRAQTKAAAEAHKAAEAAATPESRLAAQAARHVLVARYAEALPLYRQLQQSFPQNTAYAAMTRVLEQKTAGSKPGAQP